MGSVSDQLLESFVERQLAAWNSLSGADLEGLRDTPLDCDPEVFASFVERRSYPYGYAYVAILLERPGAFAVTIKLEGEPGQLSTRTHHPVITVAGDEAKLLAWLGALARNQGPRA